MIRACCGSGNRKPSLHMGFCNSELENAGPQLVQYPAPDRAIKSHVSLRCDIPHREYHGQSDRRDAGSWMALCARTGTRRVENVRMPAVVSQEKKTSGQNSSPCRIEQNPTPIQEEPKAENAIRKERGTCTRLKGWRCLAHERKNASTGAAPLLCYAHGSVGKSGPDC